jgi:hypothetical protein
LVSSMSDRKRSRVVRLRLSNGRIPSISYMSPCTLPTFDSTFNRHDCLSFSDVRVTPLRCVEGPYDFPHHSICPSPRLTPLPSAGQWGSGRARFESFIVSTSEGRWAGVVDGRRSIDTVMAAGAALK